mgnify:CR=1 FL=1
MYIIRHIKLSVYIKAYKTKCMIVVDKYLIDDNDGPQHRGDVQVHLTQECFINYLSNNSVM